ncbi:hypothetical protein [Caulobacter segnis]
MTAPDDEPNLSPMEAAEDYRRQRVESEAKKSGVSTPSPQELADLIGLNRTSLLSSIQALGASPKEAGELLDDYVSAVAAEPDRGSGAEANIQEILGKLLRAVTAIAPDTGRDGVVFGPSGELNLSASERTIPGLDISSISVGYGLPMLCHLTSGLLAHSFATAEGLEADAEGAMARVLKDKVLLNHWQRLILYCAWEGMPPPRAGWSLGISPFFREQYDLLWAMELFVAAHEFTHHAQSHTVSETSAAERDPNIDEEEADVGGYLISRRSTSSAPNPFAQSGAGAAAVLCVLDVIRKAEFALVHGEGEPPPRGDHPATRDRLALMAAVDSIEGDATSRAYRDAFADFFDLLWESLKPLMLAMRASGKLPKRNDDGGDGGGWLPL